MPLPSLIEIQPLTHPVRAEITVPGSKSITNRALILAALAEGKVTLTGALWSEDTQIMVECLKHLGFEVFVESDPNEACNRTITVIGQGGRVPPGGTEEKPLELFVGNAGTAARFLAPFLCLGSGVYRLHGVPRMHERPQAALFQALRKLGYRIESEIRYDKLPARIFGEGPKSGRCRVSIEESSQFASALLLAATVGQWNIEIAGENSDESPYVVMTERLIKTFLKKPGSFAIEPDASSGSYFLGASWILQKSLIEKAIDNIEGCETPGADFSNVAIPNWPTSHWQKDDDFEIYVKPGIGMPMSISRRHDLADSIMTAITLAPLNENQLLSIEFTDLGRLRVQECERVVALRTELTKCGAKVIEEGDTLTVYPSTLHGAEIETYNDHRMAMCFAILGLKVPGIKIKNPACVKKTFPNFFQKLAGGLGATILDANTGRKLAVDELFAE